MTSFNVNVGGRSQVLVDEQQLQSMQAEVARRGVELERLKAAMETLGSVNAPAHFLAASMALCNELAARWKSERVGIGFLQGRYVRLKALSHTERITRNMQLVQDIEAAMEESLDQDVEIIVPPPKDASFVYRATDNLSNRHGPSAVVNLPLRRERKHLKERNDERYGNVVAVLTLERKLDKPFTLSEIETLRLTSDLFTPRLVDLYENDRWIGAKALRGTRRALAWTVGAKHTWAKVAAIIISGFLAFATLVNGMFHVEAPFTIAATATQILCAAADGILEKVNVEPGDMVFTEETGRIFDDLNALNPLAPVLPIKRPVTILATLEDKDYQDQRREAENNREVHLKKADAAASRFDQAEADSERKLAEAEQAKVDFFDNQIRRRQIRTPINGVVFQGDLKSKNGIPVRAGDPLFEIGQPALRADLNISEDQIVDVQLGQKGTLKATAYPDRPIHFTVERIFPMATVVQTKNAFKVRVHIDSPNAQWLKPGVEGLAKIDVEPRKYGWIWTHKMVDWVRMKLWF
jgi:hypothetical protein